MNRLLLFIGLVVAFANPAHAEWRKAESQHFIVYSDGSERSLRDYTAKLERFDALLTSRFGGASGAARRLPVYLVGDGRALRVAVPGLPPGIAGYYSYSDVDVFAVLVRGESDDILLHEYSHHVMARAGDVQYPGWLREGFAEFFATATVEENGEASFGLPSRGRLQALQQGRWLPMDRVLRADGSLGIQNQTEMGMYYAQSWALLHWLLADAARIQKLSPYVQAVNGGQDPVDAWQSLFGLTLEQLTAELRAYTRGRLSYTKLQLPRLNPEITVTMLPASAATVLLPTINARSLNPAEVEGPTLLATLRSASARFPDDPMALVALGRAEKRWGDAAVAEASLVRALELQGDNLEGLVLMADLELERGATAASLEERTRHWDLGKDFLRRASDVDATHPLVYSAEARFRRYIRD